MKQWASRKLTWDETSIGSTRIQLVLPPDVAQAFLNSIEHSLQKVDDCPNHGSNDPLSNDPSIDRSDTSISQRRADAAVLMAETSLQAANRDIATADHFQVIVSVDAQELSESAVKLTPAKKPTLKGAGPIARETAKRIACDCSVTTNSLKHGKPCDIGRKSRLWPSAMARAIKDRDQHCQFNGCTRTHNLQIHHIVHWADGGTTCIENGVSLCQGCHTKVHEGGYRIQRVANHEQRLNEQFEQQTHVDDKALFSFETDLRNDRESFDKVRSLSPTRYRFRVVDAQGRDIRSRMADYSAGNVSYADTDSTDKETSDKLAHSTRVEWAEAKPTYYCRTKSSNVTSSNTKYSTFIVAEPRDDYRADRSPHSRMMH